MTPELSIQPCNKANIKNILTGINKYNLSKVPATHEAWTPLEFVTKDTHGEEIGGVLGGVGYWSGLEIRILWVKEEHRGKGIGTQLLSYIEKVAKESGAIISMLETFDFQAEGFYLKNGYKVIGEIKDFPKGHRRIYLSKRLDNDE